jgi:hypothetical protein
MTAFKTRCLRAWITAAATAGACLLGAAALAQDAADDSGLNPKAKGRNRAYIVQLAEPPVTAYGGGIAGLAATKPRKGQKIDPNAPAVVNYLSHLRSRHDAVLGAAGGGRKLYSYGYVFNGFAAELSAAQVEKLSRTPGVLAVSKDEARALDTATTPTFLGMTGPTGFYNTTGATGEDVIIGIVDGGIWPEHPSVSDRTGSNGNGSKDGKLEYRQLPGWHGKCVPAATVVSQGPGCATVLVVGPELPADVATKMPASAANRKAISTASRKLLCEPPTEKLMTSTPSATAWSIAATLSEPKHEPLACAGS